MDLSSPKSITDRRLLTAEEFFRQKQYTALFGEIEGLREDVFADNEYELGLFLSLRAYRNRYEGKYKESVENGLRAAKLLCNSPYNCRFGLVQLVLSQAYLAAGDLRNAEIRARDALAAYRRGNDRMGQVDSHNALAHVAYIRCDYRTAVSSLESALELAEGDEHKTAQLTGNLGTLRIRTGEWEKAERDLTYSLKYHLNKGMDAFAADDLLSLGVLQVRSRRFLMASRNLDKALEMISRLQLKREKIHHLEYAGELAFEKGDFYKAKAAYSQAYEKGMLLAPDSDVVSQPARLLSEAELALDNIDDAMKYAQKALEVGLKVGEKIEVGMARRVIAQVFAAKSDLDEARLNMRQALAIIKEVGDPYETARTLLAYADILLKDESCPNNKVRDMYDQARRLFEGLELDYWVAEVDFRSGVFACRTGDLAGGFRVLSRAERAFDALDEKSRVRSVHTFLKSLSEQAVAVAVSQENEFKIFGNLISPAEVSNLNSGQIEEILDTLIRRTNADRAIIYSPDMETDNVSSSLAMSGHQIKKFTENFDTMLGEEISKTKPTLILDCRRDPFLNELIPESVDLVASVVVVPFRTGDKATGYLYLDRLSHDNGLNPFSQADLNFAVGFSHVIAFKWAEIVKNRLMEDNLRLKSQLREKAAFPNIITRNPDMLDILAQVRQVVNSNISISIEGETGSGKDVLVRAIHYNSDRSDKRFISVNCAALPETLLESELFGYKRGAFTGADRDKAGLFEEADGGTFFLDEIGDMPLNIQAKVLRVLEEKELVRLGETVGRSVDVRIISATNKDLRQLMSEGLFRQDLYYRLSALTFRLPALRERKDDIPLLMDHFLSGTGKTVTPELMKRMVNYDWPGNIRELENEVKKLVLLAGGSSEITHDLLSGKVLAQKQSENAGRAVEVEHSDDLVFGGDYSLYDYLAHHERRFIMKALRQKRGVKKHAAELLNIPESTLRLKIKQYNIDLKNLDAAR